MFENIFKYSNNGIVVTEPVDNGNNFRIKELNPEGERIEKIKREDVIGKLITEAWPGIEEFSLLTTMRRVYKTGKPDHHPTTKYQDNRISGWRENYVFKTSTGEIINIYYDRTEEKIAEQKLKENEEKNAAILKALPDLFFKFNANGVYVDCWTSNPKLLLVPPENFIGKKIEDVLPKHISEKAHKIIEEVLITKEPKELEYYLEVNNKKRYFEARMVYDAENTILAIVRDITEKKEMLAKVLESEEKFSKIFRTSPDAILITSVPGGVIFDANQAAEGLTGYTLEEMVGKTTTELGFWMNIEERNIYIQKLFKEKQVNNYETKFKVKSGVIDTLVSGEIIEINGQNYFVTIVRNVSDLRKANRELNISEQKFRDIAENISEIVVEFDSEYNITFINSGVRDILEYTAEEMIGTKLPNYFTEESATRCKALHQQMTTKRDSSIHHCIADIIVKSGDVKILNLQWKIVFMNGSGSERTYMVARDITEEEIKRREERNQEEKLKQELREKLFSIESDLRATNNIRSVE